MSASSFESLVSRLHTSLGAARSAEALVGRARWLLEGEVAALIEEDGAVARVVAASPAGDAVWVGDHIDSLRAWYAKVVVSNALPGVTRERAEKYGDRGFGDVLVAFGAKGQRARTLIVCGGAGRGLYQSQHVFAAATLLREYDRAKAWEGVVEAERNAKEVLSRALSDGIVPEEGWADFAARIAKAGADAERARTALLPASVIYAAHQLRSEGAECRCEPREWLRQQGGADAEAYWALMEFLAGAAVGDPTVAKTVAEMVGRGPLDTAAAALALEQNWLRIRHAALSGRKGDALLTRLLPGLAAATQAFVGEAFARRRTRVHEGSKARDVLRLDRAGLRLYFAVLLLSSSELARMYLPTAEGVEQAAALGEVRREFVLHLARYVLGVVASVQRPLRGLPEKHVVTPGEMLDSVLYLVDRYAHVALGVDGRLRVREHLSRGLLAEVELHLSKAFYRDHILHVIDVFLLGHLLLRARVRMIDGEARELVAHMVELERLEAGRAESGDGRNLSPSAWRRDWAAAALLHDIGYQLGAVRGEGEDWQRAATFFRLPAEPHPPWLAVEQVRASADGLDRVLETLGDRLRKADGGGGEWLPHTSELRDHGVISALRVAQVLVHAASSGGGGDSVDWRLVREYRRALHAIAHHNLTSRKVLLRSDPLACLLRLCDELQEWNRRRINIESAVKRLYLQIEDAEGPIESHESVDAVLANLDVSRDQGSLDAGAHADGLSVRLQEPAGESGVFKFWIDYRDSLRAHFDPTTTFLSKAYALQQVDLEASAGGRRTSLEWRLELRFPRPAEYGDLNELDIYGLFAQEARELPPLDTAPSLEAARPGLSALLEGRENGTDRVAVVVAGPSSADGRVGWIACHPGTIVKPFVKFKKELLLGRAWVTASGGGAKGPV